MTLFSCLPLFVAGSFIGLRFADFDHAFRWQPVLLHRSLLTHGMLLPLLLFFTFRRQMTQPLRLFVLGVCLAMAVHLAFDLSPRGWQGLAQLHIPFYGWAGARFSIAWLALSIVVSLCLGVLLVRSMGEFCLGLGGLIVCYGISAAAEPRASFLALIVLVPAAFAALLLTKPRRAADDPPFHPSSLLRPS